MASLPTYTTVLFSGLSDSFDPSVTSSEMERGPAKQVVKNSQVLRSINATLQFTSRADALAFESWYFDTIKRIGFFDFHDTRDGQTRSVRFKGGDIGTLTPVRLGYEVSQRQVTMEYYR